MEWLAIFLVSNAFLSLFYHLATRALKFIRTWDSFARGWAGEVLPLRHFRRARRTPFGAASQRLNVLQQLTYVLLLQRGFCHFRSRRAS